MGNNAIVGQSGGPTSVINASLAGVFQACVMRGANRVYGMLNGVAGLLDERVTDLTATLGSSLEIELLKRTPSSYLGSCRYKLPDSLTHPDVYEKLFAILKKLDIGYFFYIGGNDSMDTICKLSDYAKRIGSDIRFMGVPKTIDNDLMHTDHTPGYGSAAKYIGVVMKEIIRDATVYGTNYVTIVEIIAVSEGVKLADGRYVCELSDDAHFVDAFGHKSLTGTARYLANQVAGKLKTKTRSIELSTLQRCAAHVSSRTDITEAYQVGGAAAKAAFEGHTGEMVALERISNDPYQCTTRLVDIHQIANFEKKVPLEWVNSYRTDMEPAFLQYARPLIQAELTPVYIDGLPRHIFMK